MHGKVRKRAVLRRQREFSLARKAGEDRVRIFPCFAAQKPLPRLGEAHARVQRMLAVVLCQHRLTVCPQPVQRRRCKIARRRDLDELSPRTEHGEHFHQFFFRFIEARGKVRKRHAIRAALADGLHELCLVRSALAHGERGDHARVVSLVPVRMLVQDHPAADSLERRIKAHHKAVALPRGERFAQPQLGIAALARTQRVAVQQHRLCKAHRRTVVEVQARAALDDPLRIRQILQFHVQHQRRLHRIRPAQHIAAADALFFDAR